MSRGKKNPPSGLASRSRTLRKRAGTEMRVSFLLAQAGRGHDPERSLKLCRRSDELLLRSHKLRERLRKIRDAA